MTSIPHTANQLAASRGTKFDPSTARLDDEHPSGPWGKDDEEVIDAPARARASGAFGADDEPVSGAWGKDDEPVAPVRAPRRGGTRAETQTAIDSNNHRGTGFDDPRRLDKPQPKVPAVIADEALRSAHRSQQDPILRPEFIEQLRQDYEAMAPEDRLADLRLLAGENNVRGRAARVILRDVEAENRAVRETGADRPELTDIVMRAGQPVGGGSGARPKQTAFPEVNEVARLASGQTTDDVLQRERAARTVFEAERSPQAVAGPTAKQVAAADRAKRDAEREGVGEGTWLQSPWDFYAGMASDGVSAVRDMASLELASPDALSSPLRQQIARSVHDWAGERALELDATKSRAEKAKARELQSITDDPSKGVADVLGFLFTEPLFLINRVGGAVLPMIGGGLVGKGVGRLASALGASSGVAGSAAMWGAVGSEAAQIAGGVHDKAIEAGLSREEARLATGNALVLALGIGKFTGGGASGAVAQGRHGVLRTARSEAAEEGAQHFIDPLALKAAGDVPIDWQKEVKGAVGDAVIGGVMGGVTGARPGARPPTRDEQIAAAINDGVATTHFNADAIDSYARHAGSADANTPGMTRAEWTARQQGDVGPAAPVTLRMEDMPDTPFTPQDVAHLQAAANQAHAEEFAARGIEAPVAGDKPVPVATVVDVEPPTQRVIGQAPESQTAGRNGAATAPEVPDQGPGMGATVQNTLEGRQQVARQPQPGPTQLQPGQIARGSLAREAQQVLDSRTSQKQIDAVHPAVPVADPVPRTTNTSSSPPDRLPDEPSKLSAVVERPTQQPAHVSEVSKQAAPVAPAQRAQAASDRAGKPGSAQAERFPTFQNKGAALAWSVEKRRSSTIEPVKVGDTWTLQALQVDRSRAGVASAQTAVADPTPTAGSKSMPQAAQPANMPVATHAEPGQPVEAASAPVVAASLTKAASAEGRKPSAMRADLVRQIDTVVAALPADAGQRDAQLAAFALVNKRRLESNDPHVRQALVADRERLTKDWGTHTFDVEGDGRFAVMATPGRLAAFKAKVSASAGFTAKQGVHAAPEVAGAQHGSPSAKAAIENMLDEGDVQAAVDYATAKGVDPSKMGLNPARLAKLNGVTPTPATTAAPVRSAESTITPASIAATAPELQSDADAGLVQSEPGERTAQYDASAAAVDSPARNDGDPLASARPHEMSRADFIKAVDVARTGGGATPWVASFDGRKIGAGFKTRREAITAAREAHGRAVQRAVRDGRPVQANVLADYPDIAPVSAAVESQTAPLADGSKSTESRAASRADNIAPSVRRLFEAEAFRGLEVSVDLPAGDAGAAERVIIDAAEGLALTDRRIAMIEAGHPHEYDGDAIAQAARTAMSLGANAAEARTKAVAEVMAMVRKEWAEMLATARATYPDKARELDAMLAEGAKSAEAGAARIGDAGQKIGGARKDRWKERGMGVADLDDMTEAEGATLVTKANTWKPDYASMVAAGARPKVAAMVKLVYDGLAAAPKENTPDGRRRYVTAMGLMREVYADMGRHQDLSPGVPASDASTMRRAAEELRQKMGVYDKDFTKVQDAKRLLFSVYKGRSDPFAAGYELERRADKLVEAGFPAKIEPWTRRFEISKAGGAGSTVAGTDAIVKRSAEYGTPVSAEQARAGVFAIINKTSRKTLAMAATRDDAQAAAQALYERELGAKGDGKVAPERPHLDTLTREGMDKRIDHDVAPDDFLQTFGFRGVEFGLWAANDERQRLLNMAFDGLHDLAEIIGVPPKALSLNGSMGMAFGARGGGRFAAHYEPGRLVINMTKPQGGGSLAHEWAHALDHYLGELDRADAYLTVARGASGWTTKRDYSGAPQSRHVRDGGRWVQRKVTSLDNLRPEVGHAFNGVMRALFSKQFGQAQMVRELELDLERTQASIVAAQDDATRAMHERSLKARQQSLDETRREPDDKTYSRGGSDFAKEAQKLSGKSVNGYWTRPTEMFARAFESYVFDKLLALGAKSDYLVHGVEDDRFAGGDYKGNPYPVGEERAAIDRAFDRLFGAIKTRETDKGVAMFHRTADHPEQAELNALQALSENDELFALPKPVGMTVEAIAAEIDPEIKVRQNSQGGGRTDYTLTMPDGNTGRLVVREPNKYGQQLYGFDLVEGEITNQAVGRPGENPEDVDAGTGDVWIDVSLLSPGTGGGQVYAIAAAYAHNTGRIFIGDPAGLSDEALRRRSEQMLSSALKFGTTEHLAPHPRQVAGDKKLGVPPLRWVYGDDLGNIRRLIDQNLKALDNAMPSSSKIEFDANTGRLTNTVSGVSGDSATQELLSGLPDAKRDGSGSPVALAGRRTLARGAVLRALLREAGREGATGGERDGLLARLARLANDAVPAAKGIFYSRDGVGASDALSLADVRATADEITQAWSNAPQIVVLANMAEAPAAARRANQAQLAGGATGTPAAFFMGGKVYLVASQMRSPQVVAEAVLHEALGHAGLRGVFGSRLDAVLSELADSRPELVAAKANQYGLDTTDKAQRLQAAEEVLAELAQTQPELGLVRRAIAAIRAWLRDAMPFMRNAAMSDDEIVQRFILPARRFVVGGAGSVSEPGFAFRRGADESSPFYSALARQVHGLPMKAAPASGWQQTLKGLIGSGKVKADEVAWSGLGEWLDLQQGRVSKEQVTQYLDANGVRVEDVVMGHDQPAEITVSFDSDYDGPGQGRWVSSAGGKEVGSGMTRELAEEDADEVRNDPEQSVIYNGSTSYGGFVLPGGKAYREMLLTLPGPVQYQSRHWPGHTNVLAHVRFNEHADAQGRRVLMIEELQSDWALALRRQERGQLKDDEGGDQAPAPAAPFVGKADAWVALALKRLIRYASDNGFERVAFVTGKQAHKRFSDNLGGDAALASTSALYGEADGSVRDNRGRSTGKTPILHSVAKDVLRKLGGAGLLKMQIIGKGRTMLDQVGFDITPELREKVAGGVPMFARADKAGASYASFKQWLENNPERDYSKLQLVNAEARFEQSPVTEVAANESGKRPTLHADIDPESDEFKTWFAGSKLVDDKGEPMPLYGRANESGRYPPKNAGRYGMGAYFGAEPASAFNLGMGAITPAFVVMRSPYTHEVQSGADAAASLARAVLPEASAEVTARRLRRGEQIGGAVRQTLMAKGHDGLIVRFASPADGQTAYVAFSTPQARQVTQRPAITSEGRWATEPTDQADGQQDIQQDGQAPDADIRFSRREAQADTRAFKAWFGDSKVVDAQGRPLVVYHGTNRDFSAFDAGAKSRHIPLPGFYFSPDPERASIFAGNFGDDPGNNPGANVMPVYVSLRSPLDVDVAAGAMKGFVDAKVIKEILDEAKRKGHDGVILRGWKDGSGPIQYVAFSPEQIKSATGNNGAFDPANADIRFQRVASDHTLRHFGRAGRAIEVMQDRYNRWKHAIDDVRKQGGTVTDENDFYRAEERYWGRVGGSMDTFHDELQRWVKAVAADGLTLDDVAQFAYAQHAEERNEYIAEKRPDMPDGGSGMTTDEADSILESARQSGLEPALVAHAETLRDWTQGTRDVLLDGGLISDDQYGAWTGMFDKYVPLRGLEGAPEVLGTGKGYVIRGKEGREAHGRRTEARQIIEQVVQDRTRALIRSGKNEVLRAFARFVLDNPSPNLWEVNAVEFKPTITTDDHGNRIVEDKTTIIKDERTVTMKDGGKEIHILVKDQKLLSQLRHLDLENDPAWPIAALLFANRILSRLYTSLSPAFAVVNLIRDVTAASIGVIDEIGFMAMPKLYAKMPKALWDSWRAEAGHRSTDYQLYVAFGGKTSFFSLKTLDDQANELQAMLDNAGRVAIDPRKMLPKALSLIEAINGGIENATRLAVFELARESGMSGVKAASAAKNITVNFNRKGLQQWASAWVLFFNPAVQGTARIAQSLSHPKVQATIGLAMVGVAALALRNAAMGDDDDGVAWWDKIPDEVKERNLIIILPPGAKSGEAIKGSKTGRYVKVPMPYGYSFFAVVANQVVDVWRHGHDPRRGRNALAGTVRAFNAFTSSFLPAQDMGRALSPDSGETASKSAVLMAVPDALDPIAQIALNQSAFGRKLRPDDNHNRFAPDSQVYFPGQAGTLWARAAAKMNAATGGTKYSPGQLDAHPSSIENLARAYGGGPLMFGLDIVNAMYMRQSIERPDLDAKRLPFAKQFYGVIDAETDRLTGYKRLEDAERVTDPIKRAMRDGAGADARAMVKDGGAVAGLGDAILTTRSLLANLRKHEQAVVGNERMADDIKFAQLMTLAEQRREVMHAFTLAYDRAIMAQTGQAEQTRAAQPAGGR